MVSRQRRILFAVLELAFGGEVPARQGKPIHRYPRRGLASDYKASFQRPPLICPFLSVNGFLRAKRLLSGGNQSTTPKGFVVVSLSLLAGCTA